MVIPRTTLNCYPFTSDMDITIAHSRTRTSSQMYRVSILRLSTGRQVSWNLVVGYTEARRDIQNRWSGPWASGSFSVTALKRQYFGFADSFRGENWTCFHPPNVTVHPRLRVRRRMPSKVNI